MLLTVKNKLGYTAKYDSILLRGVDDPNTPRPWNLFDEIKKYTSDNKTLLDIGCGTAFKLFHLSPYLKKIFGLDISENMLEAANKNIFHNEIKNIKVINGLASKLPFPDKSIDIITCLLATWDAKEIWRVLKDDGSVVIEFIGCEDKKDFKILFGKDEQGWRGQFIDYSLEEYINLCYEDFFRFFESVTIKNGYWDTYYSIEGIIQLLNYTPTIRHFDYQKDEIKLNEAIKIFSTEKGIKLTQNRMLIHVKNPRISEIKKK